MNAPQYDGLAQVYDEWTLADPAAQETRQFYLDRAAGVAKVLEFGIGTGRIAVPLAVSGAHVHGIDISPAMLAACQHRASQADVAHRLTLQLGDMLTCPLPGSYELMLMPFRTFGHILHLSDKVAFLRRVRDGLAPGGCFVFDHYILNRSWAETHDAVPRLMRQSWGDGMMIWDTYQYEFDAQVMHCVITVERMRPDGTVCERRHHPLSFSWVMPEQVLEIAGQAGLEVVSVSGDFAGGPLGENSSNQVWTLRRPART
jgi:SAM-dependent methyltransferase